MLIKLPAYDSFRLGHQISSISARAPKQSRQCKRGEAKVKANCKKPRDSKSIPTHANAYRTTARLVMTNVPRQTSIRINQRSLLEIKRGFHRFMTMSSKNTAESEETKVLVYTCIYCLHDPKDIHCLYLFVIPKTFTKVSVCGIWQRNGHVATHKHGGSCAFASKISQPRGVPTRRVTHFCFGLKACNSC